MSETRGSQLLARALDRKGLSQQELETRIGASAGIVSRWLAGKRRPSLEWATTLRKVLGIPSSAWLEPPDSGASAGK